MADTLISACQLLRDRYNGNARNIWRTDSARQIIERLSEFKGVSQKLANMGTRFLGIYYGVPLTDWNKIDLPVDRHVARVFLRTGLIKPKNQATVQPVAVFRDAIIQKARLLSPAFPAALDEPAFDVGRYWCRPENPYCEDSKEPCPLHKSCPRLIDLDVK
jgi:endonuclease III